MLLLDLKPTLFNIEPIECSNRKEIICVVDRSGSMSGTAMRNAKEALKMFIRFRDSRTYLRTSRHNRWSNTSGPYWHSPGNTDKVIAMRRYLHQHLFIWKQIQLGRKLTWHSVSSIIPSYTHCLTVKHFITRHWTSCITWATAQQF